MIFTIFSTFYDCKKRIKKLWNFYQTFQEIQISWNENSLLLDPIRTMIKWKIILSLKVVLMKIYNSLTFFFVDNFSFSKPKIQLLVMKSFRFQTDSKQNTICFCQKHPINLTTDCISSSIVLCESSDSWISTYDLNSAKVHVYPFSHHSRPLSFSTPFNIEFHSIC